MVIRFLLNKDYDSVLDYCYSNPLEIQYVKSDLNYCLNKKKIVELEFLDFFVNLFRICPGVRSYMSDILVDLFYNLSKMYNLINYYNTFMYETLLEFDTAYKLCSVLRIEFDPNVKYFVPLEKTQRYYIFDYKIYN